MCNTLRIHVFNMIYATLCETKCVVIECIFRSPAESRGEGAKVPVVRRSGERARAARRQGTALGFGGGEAPPTRVRSVFQKKPYHAVAVLAAVGVGPS